MYGSKIFWATVIFVGGSMEPKMCSTSHVDQIINGV